MSEPNEKNIKWIIREIEKGSSVSEIARLWKASRPWVNELHRRYKETGEIPALGRPSRPASPPSEEIVDTVLNCDSGQETGQDGEPLGDTPNR